MIEISSEYRDRDIYDGVGLFNIKNNNNNHVSEYAPLIYFNPFHFNLKNDDNISCIIHESTGDFTYFRPLNDEEINKEENYYINSLILTNKHKIYKIKSFERINNKLYKISIDNFNNSDRVLVDDFVICYRNKRIDNTIILFVPNLHKINYYPKLFLYDEIKKKYHEIINLDFSSNLIFLDSKNFNNEYLNDNIYSIRQYSKKNNCLFFDDYLYSFDNNDIGKVNDFIKFDNKIGKIKSITNNSKDNSYEIRYDIINEIFNFPINEYESNDRKTVKFNESFDLYPSDNIVNNIIFKHKYKNISITVNKIVLPNMLLDTCKKTEEYKYIYLDIISINGNNIRFILFKELDKSAGDIIFYGDNNSYNINIINDEILFKISLPDGNIFNLLEHDSKIPTKCVKHNQSKIFIDIKSMFRYSLFTKYIKI